MTALQKSLWDHIPEKKWKDFKEAREFARRLNLCNIIHWDRYISGKYNKLPPLPMDIPCDPHVQYRHSGWKSWNDWLGILSSKTEPAKHLNTIWDLNEKTRWMPFKEARRIAQDYEFEYKEEWEAFIEGKFPERSPLPLEIPANPDKVYRHTGWKGWQDWLVSNENRKEYTSFFKAREFVHSLRLKDIVAWRDYILSDKNLHIRNNLVIPVKPDLEYQNKGWKDWKDWLGLEIRFNDHDTTRNFIKSLKLKNKTEWTSYCINQLSGKKPKPENIFSYPEIAYKNEGWRNWNYWLGNNFDQVTYSGPQSNDEKEECRCKGRIKDCPECDGKGYIGIKTGNILKK